MKLISARLLQAYIVTMSVAIFLLGCSANKQENKSDKRIADSLGLVDVPREKTLYVGGFQWGAATTFNPLAVTPAWPVTGNINLIYQALFGYDMLSGQLKPVLGKSYKLNGKMLHVELFEQAKWQNGDNLTSDDVVYSYNLHKNYATNFSFGIGNFISEVKTDGRHSVLIILNDKEFNPLVVFDIISTVQILPEKIFKKLEQAAFNRVATETGAAPDNSDVLNAIRDFTNDKLPVGSGPYTLEAYTEQKIVLKRIPSYWGNSLHGNKDAAPLYIVHSTYESNDKFNQALQSGDLDISQTFFPQIWSNFSKGVGTWYDKEPYYIPGIIPALLMGLTKPPLDDVNFRRAALHAINYDEIKNKAVYGYTPELRSGIILPFGTESQYFQEIDAVASGKLHDPQKARRILKSAGYTWGSDSLLIDPSGKKIRQLIATCPIGWTDWEATLKIAVEGMRAVGFDVREKFVEYAQWDKDLKNGLFDFTMKTPHPEQSYSLPWARFDRVMSSKDWRPVGEVMYHNEGRYTNKTADSLLAVIPKLDDPEKLKEAYAAINRLFMSEVPVIPLMYRPWLFYQFSTKNWKNFPTAANPYANPQCLMVGAGCEALWGLVPAK
jgi:peptide/nickel transport system substrate-binding protein